MKNLKKFFFLLLATILISGCSDLDSSKAKINISLPDLSSRVLADGSLEAGECRISFKNSMDKSQDFERVLSSGNTELSEEIEAGEWTISVEMLSAGEVTYSGSSETFTAEPGEELTVTIKIKKQSSETTDPTDTPAADPTGTQTTDPTDTPSTDPSGTQTTDPEDNTNPDSGETEDVTVVIDVQPEGSIVKIEGTVTSADAVLSCSAHSSNGGEVLFYWVDAESESEISTTITTEEMTTLISKMSEMKGTKQETTGCYTSTHTVNVAGGQAVYSVCIVMDMTSLMSQKIVSKNTNPVCVKGESAVENTETVLAAVEVAAATSYSLSGSQSLTGTIGISSDGVSISPATDAESDVVIKRSDDCQTSTMIELKDVKSQLTLSGTEENNLVIDGSTNLSYLNGPAVKVDNGVLIINPGTIIQNNKNAITDSSGQAGAIYVTGQNSSVIANGLVCTGNSNTVANNGTTITIGSIGIHNGAQLTIGGTSRIDGIYFNNSGSGAPVINVLKDFENKDESGEDVKVQIVIAKFEETESGTGKMKLITFEEGYSLNDKFEVTDLSGTAYILDSDGYISKGAVYGNVTVSVTYPSFSSSTYTITSTLNNTFDFSINGLTSGTFDSIVWYVDGTEDTDLTGTTISLSADKMSSYSAGIHELKAIITIGSEVSEAVCNLTITK